MTYNVVMLPPTVAEERNLPRPAPFQNITKTEKYPEKYLSSN